MHHCKLNNVAFGPLDRCVDGHSLRLRPHIRKGGFHLGKLPSSTKQGLGITMLTSETFCTLKILGERLKSFKVIFKKCMRLGSCRPELGTERIHSHTIQDPEVNRLCTAAHLQINLIRGDMKNVRGHFAVYVAAIAKYFAEFLILREERRDAKLDLRVVNFYKR